jgi:hypothetical protein
LFSWKVAGNIPSIDLRLSDKRLFQLINHIQSIPLPESKNPAIVAPPIAADVCLIEFLIPEHSDIRFLGNTCTIIIEQSGKNIRNSRRHDTGFKNKRKS